MEDLEAAGRRADLGGPVFYREWEGPSRHTFVLVHGLAGSHVNWLRVAPALVEHGRVLAPDLAGSGFTPRAGRSSGVPANRALLDAFIREVAGGPVVLCGNSLGGSIALLQAACEPKTVAAVVLNGAALPPPAGKRPPLAMLAGTAGYSVPIVGGLLGRIRVRGLSPEMLVRIGFRVLLGGDSTSLPEDVVRAHIEMARAQQQDPDASRAFVETARSAVALLRAPDRAHAYLKAVAQPVLMMHGGKDRIVPANPTLAAARPDWDIHVFPELGHVIQLEAPGLWLSTVVNWLQTQPATR